ncbi:hypothetical protein ISN45_Aa04g011780 [Arabidopsis thaliana x Arabidopsis arenosa]|uniref:Uncharacterized protein n=1 Tax=Arabidopsis thaliana x Arabidopsis arenosa TaxID=1240361 RepID=A0A8T2A8T3_9BRAS|nr:hypothetical protein ISN45_Aa04g011780 [Arabidopsis thaliana x Arabidopsis arenosa]
MFWNDYNRCLSTQANDPPPVRRGSSSRGTAQSSRTAALPQTSNSQNNRAGGSTPPPTNPNSPIQPSHSATPPPIACLNNLTLEELLDSPERQSLTRLDPNRPPETLWSINERVNKVFEEKLKDRMSDQVFRWKEKWKNKVHSLYLCGLYQVAPRKKGRMYGVGSLQHEASSVHVGPPPTHNDPVVLPEKLAAAEARLQSQAEKINSFDAYFEYLVEKDPVFKHEPHPSVGTSSISAAHENHKEPHPSVGTSSISVSYSDTCSTAEKGRGNKSLNLLPSPDRSPIPIGGREKRIPAEIGKARDWEGQRSGRPENFEVESRNRGIVEAVVRDTGGDRIFRWRRSRFRRRRRDSWSSKMREDGTFGSDGGEFTK